MDRVERLGGLDTLAPQMSDAKKHFGHRFRFRNDAQKSMTAGFLLISLVPHE
jgi:hypothetical protein